LYARLENNLLGPKYYNYNLKTKERLGLGGKSLQESAFLKPLFCSCIRLPICYLFNTKSNIRLATENSTYRL